MSQTARELLIRGMSAAAVGDAEEARYFLEWVLRTDSTYEQKADAHYWLSRAAADPAEKRHHLESALASFPHYPEARRDLAILDGRLKAEELVDHRQGVMPVALPAQIEAGAVHSSSCPRCGARLRYSPDTRVPACQFCGYRTGEPVEERVEEQDWIAAVYTRRGHTWALPAERVLACEGCGASVSFAPSHISAGCAHCGSSYVVREGVSDLDEPDGIVPFASDAAQAVEHARRWIDEARFRPGDLDELAAFSVPRPLYLPFWTFDVEGEIRWTRMVEESSFGLKGMVPERGSHLVSYDDLLVPATRSVSWELLADLGFDTKGLISYDPALLADWPAELYSVTAADAAVEAHARALRESKEAIESPWGGEAGSMEMEPPSVSISSYKLVLLPIWLARYTYHGREFEVAVNGSTGETHGDLPRGRLQSFLGSLFSE